MDTKGHMVFMYSIVEFSYKRMDFFRFSQQTG